MRTTVDIHDALDSEIRLRANQLGLSYKDALNRVIAAGLPALAVEQPVFEVRAKACGWKPGYDLLHLNKLADELEDEEFSR